jgi:hypothetical protein
MSDTPAFMQGACAGLCRTSAPEGAALASLTDTSCESEDSTGPSDKWPVPAQRGRTTFEQRTSEMTTNALPEYGFLLRTSPFRWKGACRRTVSLWRTRVSKPTSGGRTDVRKTQARRRSPAGAGHSSPASRRRASWPDLL